MEKINISEWVTKWAFLKPNKPAIIYEDSTITYKDLNERINRTARMLQGLGVGKGDRVGVLMHNTYQLIEIFFALGKLGAILVPLNTRLVSAELEYIIKDSGLTALVFGEAFTDVLESLRMNLTINKDHYFCLGKNPAWAHDYEQAIMAQKSVDEPVVHEPAGGEDPIIIMYTSGTTGLPKGAILSHRKTFFNALNANIYYGLAPSDIMISPRPMFHSGGLLVELCPMIYKGGTLVMRGRFKPEEILTAIERYKATILEVAATVLRFILEQCDIDKYRPLFPEGLLYRRRTGPPDAPGGLRKEGHHHLPDLRPDRDLHGHLASGGGRRAEARLRRETRLPRRCQNRRYGRQRGGPGRGRGDRRGRLHRHERLLGEAGADGRHHR